MDIFPYNESLSVSSAFPIIKETIPMTALGYSTNNKYPNFPPLMSDGRPITATTQPDAVINADIIKSNNIKSNWEYRQFLTRNADNIIKYNFTESSNDIGYYKRPLDVLDIRTNTAPSSTYTPYKYTSVMDNSRPNGYSSSDLKDAYLSREQLNSRKISPVVTQEQILKYMSAQ